MDSGASHTGKYTESTGWRNLTAGMLSASILGGCLNVASSVLLEPGRLFSFSVLADCLAATIALLVVAQVTTLVANYYGSFHFRWRPAGVCWAVAAFIGIISGSYPLLGIEELSGTEGTAFLRQLLFLATVLSFATGVAILGYVATHRLQHRPLARILGRIAVLWAPFLGIQTVLLFWLQIYRIERFSSAMSLLSLAGYLGGAILSFLLLRSLAHRIRPLLVLLTATLLVLSLPWVSRAGRRIAEILSATGRSEKATTIANVLLVTVDTLRADAVSESSAARNFRALLDDSVVFPNARSPSPWTKPAVASLLTGLPPSVHRMTEWNSYLPDEITTLAEAMGGRGFRTAAIGMNPTLDRMYNFDQGFLEYHFTYGDAGRSFGARLLQTIQPLQYGETSTEYLTETAIHWIELDHQRPFFLWLHYFDPHLPYAPPHDLLPDAAPPSGIGFEFAGLSRVRSGHFVPSGEEKEWMRRLYDAEVRYVDANLGRLIKALKELNLYEGSLIVLTSDHGEEFWEHGGFEHGHTVYDEVVRVPLSFKLPSSRSTAEIAANVSTVAVTPTILDVLDVDPAPINHASYGFHSLSALWSTSPPADWPPTISSETLYYEEKEAIVLNGFKYIHEPSTGREELYDLIHDPLERVSLIGTSSEIAVRARRLLGEHQRFGEETRQALGLEERRGDPDEGLSEELRTLGYIQ